MSTTSPTLPSLTPGLEGSSGAQAEAPHPTGGPPVAPANAALIRLWVPDKFAEVTFNGQQASGIGTSRDYVTPDLPAGQKQHYKITAAWGKGDKQRTVERDIDVGPGQVARVDFTQAPSSSAK
jgi:uncharacterized protein (TIGR03000 family)